MHFIRYVSLKISNVLRRCMCMNSNINDDDDIYDTYDADSSVSYKLKRVRLIHTLQKMPCFKNDMIIQHIMNNVKSTVDCDAVLLNLLTDKKQYTIYTSKHDKVKMPQTMKFEDSICKNLLELNLEYLDLSSKRHHNCPYFESYYGIPIKVQNEIVGALCVLGNNERGQYEKHKRKSIDECASLIEYRLNEKLKERNINSSLSDIPRNLVHNIENTCEIERRSLETNFYEDAIVTFMDIVNYSTLVKTSNDDLHILRKTHEIFSEIDGLCEVHNINKIRTIGDGYLIKSSTEHPIEMNVLIMFLFINKVIYICNIKNKVSLRVGSSIGSFFGAILGQSSIQFDIYGYTVNYSARIEQNSPHNKISVCSRFFEILTSELPDYINIIHTTQEIKFKNMGTQTIYSIEPLNIITLNQLENYISTYNFLSTNS